METPKLSELTDAQLSELLDLVSQEIKTRYMKNIKSNEEHEKAVKKVFQNIIETIRSNG
jgi:hypothetical protein